MIKEIVFRASERLNLPVILVANKPLGKHHSRLISSVVVEDGFDIADDYIAEQATAQDLVITADIPLAARIVAKGATGIDPRGELYTEKNVGERLSIRDLMRQIAIKLVNNYLVKIQTQRSTCTTRSVLTRSVLEGIFWTCRR